jgi:hypothetical protein
MSGALSDSPVDVDVRLCTDEAEAVAALGAGAAVVLVGADGDAVGRAARALREAWPGRVAVMVGDPTEAEVQAAAADLAAELFQRGEPTDRAPGAPTSPSNVV